MFHFMTLIQLLSQMLFINQHLNNGEKNHPLIKIEKVFNYTFQEVNHKNP